MEDKIGKIEAGLKKLEDLESISNEAFAYLLTSTFSSLNFQQLYGLFLSFMKEQPDMRKSILNLLKEKGVKEIVEEVRRRRRDPTIRRV
jgi:hypothetical protein